MQKPTPLKLEAWGLNALAKQYIISTERRIVRMMRGVSLVDRVPTEQLFGRLDSPALFSVWTLQTFFLWLSTRQRKETDAKKSQDKRSGKLDENTPAQERRHHQMGLVALAVQARLADPVDWEKMEGNDDDTYSIILITHLLFNKKGKVTA